ncbi:MAG: 2-C-methyl-D-erythritol 2,4-cyclodiphosphate synthase [Acidimicrobiales bacterium]
MTMKIGQGIDVHRFSGDPARELWLGLVYIPNERGLEGHSDADVVTHALCDALLGAACLGDLGRHFSDADPAFRGVASRYLLVETTELIRGEGYRVASADVTIIAEQPKLVPFMDAMARELSDVVGVVVSVKATTTEGLGALGRVEGIAASAIALLDEA